MTSATNFTVTHGTKQVHVSISPCSWMYRGYGLQFGMALKDGAHTAETVFVCDKTINAQAMSTEELRATAISLTQEWLSKNGLAQLAKAADEFADACAKFDKEQEKYEAKQRAKDAVMHAKRKAEGFTHRFIGVVHPKSGDDYQVIAYCKGNPSSEAVNSLLKKSVVKTDFIVSPL